jgi:hypothetical protein
MALTQILEGQQMLLLRMVVTAPDSERKRVRWLGNYETNLHNRQIDHK